MKDQFIQSPIGLVPKAGGKTRLIFHLSYDFKNGNTSVDANMPKEQCHIKYKDLDFAIDACIKLLKVHGRTATLFYSKTDVKSTFHLVPVLILHQKWLMMCAEDPTTGELMYFIDMCLPFGASISCAVFQAFSDALQYLVEFLLEVNNIIMNCLDDFLFIAVVKQSCNEMMTVFIKLCKRINYPLSEEKTEWSSSIMIIIIIIIIVYFLLS